MTRIIPFKIFFLLMTLTVSLIANAIEVKKCSELRDEKKAEIGILKEGKDLAGQSGEVYMKLPQSLTVKQAMALFADFRTHKEIFPLVKRSVVLSKPGILSWDVKYVLNRGPFEVQYTLLDELKTDANQSFFRMDWKKSTAPDSIDQIQGSVVFENVGGFVCMTYLNRIDLNANARSEFKLLMGVPGISDQINREAANKLWWAMKEAISSPDKKEELNNKVIDLDVVLGAATGSVTLQKTPAGPPPKILPR